MRVLFQVEGSTDETVLPILVSRITAQPVHPVFRRRRVGGVDAVFGTLVPALSAAARDGCDAAVVHVDADASTSHDVHAPNEPASCRHCDVSQRLRDLTARADLRSLKVAIAVPIQAIEAWLLGLAYRIDVRPAGPPQTFDRQDAKRQIWGHMAPTRAQVRDVATRVVEPATADDLARLADQQPSFRRFHDAVKSWPAVPA